MDGIILDDIRKLIGGESYGEDFDTDLIIHTNTALFILSQMGIGKSNFAIEQGNETWREFLESKQYNLRAVKSWVVLKVRMLFDPPTSSVLAEAIKSNLEELEWRIYITENFNEPLQ